MEPYQHLDATIFHQRIAIQKILARKLCLYIVTKYGLNRWESFFNKDYFLMLINFRYENVYHPEDGMDHTEEVIKVCGYCPENYPWLHNPMGN